MPTINATPQTTLQQIFDAFNLGVPVTTPTPQPASGNTPNPNVLCNIGDGAVTLAYTEPTGKTPWLVTQWGLKQDGAGGFWSFRGPGRDNVIRDSVMLNGGFVNNDTTPGQLQSCLDIVGYFDSKLAAISITGRYGAAPTGMLPTDNTFALGGPANRWTYACFVEQPAPAKIKALPGNPKRVFIVNGGMVPIYD